MRLAAMTTPLVNILIGNRNRDENDDSEEIISDDYYSGEEVGFGTESE